VHPVLPTTPEARMAHSHRAAVTWSPAHEAPQKDTTIPHAKLVAYEDGRWLFCVHSGQPSAIAASERQVKNTNTLVGGTTQQISTPLSCRSWLILLYIQFPCLRQHLARRRGEVHWWEGAPAARAARAPDLPTAQKTASWNSAHRAKGPQLVHLRKLHRQKSLAAQ
jgi:hypothetical protein